MEKCKRKRKYPKWANYKTIDTNGDKWVYEKKPYFEDYKWSVYDLNSRRLSVGSGKPRSYRKASKSIRRIISKQTINNQACSPKGC